MNWLAFRMCPVCKARTGEACYSLSGKIIAVDGLSVPDGQRTELRKPHSSRQERTRD